MVFYIKNAIKKLALTSIFNFDVFSASVVCNFPNVWHTHFEDNYGMNEITKLDNEENRSFDFSFKCRGKM